jgi:type I restriction enzyme S subunit
MTEKWIETTVGEWCPFSYGKGLPERNRNGGSVPVFGSNGIVGWHDKSLVHGPGVIIGRKGTVGSVILSKELFWPIDTTFYIAEANHRDLCFAAALLQSLGLDQRNSHSAVPGLSRDDAHQLAILVPPLEEQHRISNVLGALDERIDSATRLEKILGEAMIAEYELALEERAQEQVISLVDAVSLVNGGAYTKGADGTGRMVIRIKELNSGPSETTVYNSIAVPNDKTALPGDVLFAWSGSLGVWRWYRDEAIINQHIFKVLPNKHPIWLGWIQVLDELERFQDIAAGKATTMGHITKDHLERTLVPTFTSDELNALSKRVEPLWEAQLQAGRELQTLRAVRDQLLPALISGELQVVETTELVETAI